jgi:hypothetical protein
MTSSAEGRARTRTLARPATIAVAAMLFAACGGDGPAAPPREAPCDGAPQAVLSLGRFEATVLTGEAVHCTVLAGAGATYLVMPHLTGPTLPYGGYGFRIGDPDASPTLAFVDAESLVEDGVLGQVPAPDAQTQLDGALRARERAMRTPGRTGALLRGDGDATPHALAPTRRFSVLSTLDATPVWSPADAALRFEGDRVAIYVDTAAASVLSDTEVHEMGALYDGVLAAQAFAAFGPASDIDGNGKVIFLLTPIVNAMVTAQQCAASGFVRGFFYGHDLSSSAPTANGGEVVYGYVPDPTGRWSCAHTKSAVLANLPPTYIHELQHLISFGAHAIVRGGPSEEPWLNEGLSHLAEELGSLYWETLFPAPSGRTDPSQLFPDSAAAYINPNLLYSYRFLFSSGSYSLTACAPGSFCTQSERGGVWLFLRWIADQKGSTALRQLVQTALAGRTNLEAVTGETTPALLADFAITVSADSLDGISRSRIAPRYRLQTRNLRTIYRKLFEVFGIAGGVGRPFPIAPIPLGAGVARTGTMRPGTFLTYALSTSAGSASVSLRFSVPDGSAFTAASGAQVSIIRVD